MYWRLSDTVTACIASDRVIFLDVVRDRYSAAPEPINDDLADWLTTTRQSPPPESCRNLIFDLTARDDSAPKSVIIEMPASIDAEVLPRQTLTIAPLLTIGRKVWKAAYDVRTKPLRNVLDDRFAARQRVEDGADQRRRQRIATFRSTRPFIPVPRVCLHDCLALLDWLGPEAADCKLVFGVVAYPFAAHSWVQAEGRVQDDHPESVSRFQPILHLP